MMLAHIHSLLSDVCRCVTVPWSTAIIRLCRGKKTFDLLCAVSEKSGLLVSLANDQPEKSAPTHIHHLPHALHSHACAVCILLVPGNFIVMNCSSWKIMAQAQRTGLQGVRECVDLLSHVSLNGFAMFAHGATRPLMKSLVAL